MTLRRLGERTQNNRSRVGLIDEGDEQVPRFDGKNMAKNSNSNQADKRIVVLSMDDKAWASFSQPQPLCPL